MGIVCCNPKKNLCNTETIQIEEEVLDNSKSIYNNINQNQNTGINKSTTGKNSSKKPSSKHTPHILINRGSTFDNIDILKTSKLKIKKVNLNQKRKSFAISMDNTFKNKFLYQKKITNSKNLLGNNLHEKIYQIPPNQSNKSLLIIEDEEYKYLKVNDIDNKIDNNKEKDNINSTRKSTMTDNILKRSSSLSKDKKKKSFYKRNK